MLYKLSYNDITLLVRQTHSQKEWSCNFLKLARSAFKESGYTNRQFQLTSYFRNTLEFIRTV